MLIVFAYRARPRACFDVRREEALLRGGSTAAHDGRRSIGKTKNSSFTSRFRRPGDYGGVAAPDPIPNSAVKRPSANGTSS
jgi:hypothetical protein